MIVPREHERALPRGVGQLREKRIDGLVVPLVSNLPEVTVFLTEAPDLPVAVVQPGVPTELPAVYFDHAAATRLAVEHLADLGHKTMLWLAPQPGKHGGPYELRENGFMRAALAHGVRASFCHIDKRSDPTCVRDDETMRTQAEAALEQYLRQSPELPTGLVCGNDVMAVAACRALLRHGLRIPKDVSVVGIDNTDPATQLIRLTTVDHILGEMARRATEIVLEMSDGDEQARRRCRGHSETIQPELVVRESTAPPPER